MSNSGEEMSRELIKNYPLVKIVALSMNGDEQTILKMIKAGACAYLLKDIHPIELEKALYQISEKGHYSGDQTNTNFRRLLMLDQNMVKITTQEERFLQLAKSDLTYKEIASQMKVSERTIDGYRENLFNKLNVQSRVGMVMQALKRKILEL